MPSILAAGKFTFNDAAVAPSLATASDQIGFVGAARDVKGTYVFVLKTAYDRSYFASVSHRPKHMAVTEVAFSALSSGAKALFSGVESTRPCVKVLVTAAADGTTAADAGDLTCTVIGEVP